MADDIRDAPADASKLLYSPYLCAAEIPPDGWVVLIRDVKEIALQKNAIVPTAQTKALVMFNGTNGKPIEKPMVFNKTNIKTVMKLYGRNWRQNWLGKPITLYATTCEAKGGKVVDCIRVRPDAPSISTQAQTAQPEQAPREPGSDDQ